MRWALKHGGAPCRVNHAAVVIGHKIYSFGGYCSHDRLTYYDEIDVFCFDTGSLTWKKIKSRGGDVPRIVFGHSVVAHGHLVYLWGGQNHSGDANRLFCFNTQTLTWSSSTTNVAANIPLTDAHSACVINNYMYIFGGFIAISHTLSDAVYRMDLDTLVWEHVQTRGQPPTLRDFHTASVIGDRMYIFGGRSFTDNVTYSGEYYANDIIYLDTTSMTWVAPETPPPRPCGRRSHSANVYNGEIYIFGGFNGHDRIHLNDIMKYNPILDTWTKIEANGIGPSPRRRHSAVVLEDILYLFGGTSPAKNTASAALLNANNLRENGDLHLLEFFSSLKRLCQLKIISSNLNVSYLPTSLQCEINTIVEFTRK